MKKILSYLLVITMSLTFLSFKAFAKEDPKISLTNAIQIAKEQLNLKTDNLNVSSTYNQNKNNSYWNLTWVSKDAKNNININATIDANTGDITRYNIWKNTDATYSKIPKYSKAQALTVAENFIKKLQKDKFSQLKLVETPEQKLIKYNFQDDYYSFKYIRVVNNLDYEDNGVTITVNKNTLDINNYSFDWNYSEFPKPDKIMTIDEAKKIFKEKIGIQLSYHLLYRYNQKNLKPMLVYMLNNSNKAIDASTGELLNERYIGPYYLDNTTAKAKSMDTSQLTPEEQKTIEENSKYLSKDKAIETGRKAISLEDKFILDSANLMKDYFDNPIWNLSFNYNDKANKTSGNAYVMINALDGTILSFSVYDSKDTPAENTKPVYSQDQCKKIAEDYINSTQGDKFKSSIYKNDNYETDEKPQGEYYFRYIRLVNNIPFDENGFNVSVNAYTGKITSYTMNWNNFDFPSASGALDIEKAYNILFDKQAFSLKYITTTDDNDSDVVKLAYKLNNYSGLQDPMTGAVLDSSGKPVKEIVVKEFKDISKSIYANDIQLLVSMGIIDVDQDNFSPNSNILQKDFIKYVVKSLNPYISSSSDDTLNEDESSNYDKYYDEAISRKLISNTDKKPNSVVTREQASKVLVRALGIGFISDQPGLFITNFKDNKKINSKYLNYAAIAANLKLLQPVKGYFYPAKQITKGEAASLIVKLLKTDTNIK